MDAFYFALKSEYRAELSSPLTARATVLTFESEIHNRSGSS